MLNWLVLRLLSLLFAAQKNARILGKSSNIRTAWDSTVYHVCYVSPLSSIVSPKKQ